jgi:signal transduction histidine kinase
VLVRAICILRIVKEVGTSYSLFLSPALAHSCPRLFDFARFLVNKVPPRHDRLDIDQAILDVIEFTRSELLRKGVSLQTELAKGLASVRGDRVQLQ